MANLFGPPFSTISSTNALSFFVSCRGRRLIQTLSALDKQWIFASSSHGASLSGARTCDHLIMSQVTNFSNNPRSNHFVKLSNINGFELIATIPAIAQAMYGIYRTINYD